MSQSLDPVRAKRRVRWLRWIIVLLVLVGTRYALYPKRVAILSAGTTAVVKRGPLPITVVEGGSVAALESQDIKCEVQGVTKILSIVEEGYNVTQEDVDKAKILVEFDSKDLVDKQTAKELEYQNAASALAGAVADYEVQINQNASDLTAAELAVQFARMDLQRLLGAQIAADILARYGLLTYEKKAEEGKKKALDVSFIESLDLTAMSQKGTAKPEGTNKPADPAQTGSADKVTEVMETHMSDDDEIPLPDVDFTAFADVDKLGDGGAQQQLRTLQDTVVMNKKELSVAKTKFEGTERLAKKDFVTKNDLETERLLVEHSEVNLRSAEVSLELYVKYQFIKDSRTALSGYVEGLRKYQRALQLAISKLAQANARRKAAEATFQLQTTKRKELVDQLAKCRVAAKRVGLVVYGGEENNWRGDDRIQEGAQVRERQQIITIPDMNNMGVKVKIHEGSINSIAKGQKARIRIDAYPDEDLTGEVVKVGILPDAQNRWMNPDLKVYEVQISIPGKRDWLRPGLSAQVEILIKEIPDILYVPIQAVVPLDDVRVCYVAGLTGNEKRIIKTGEFNNESIEITSGLSEGDKVLLRAPVEPPKADKNAATRKDKKDVDKDNQKLKLPPAPPKDDAPKPAEAAPAAQPVKPVEAAKSEKPA